MLFSMLVEHPFGISNLKFHHLLIIPRLSTIFFVGDTLLLYQSVLMVPYEEVHPTLTPLPLPPKKAGHTFDISHTKFSTPAHKNRYSILLKVRVSDTV